jgi:pectate lyase C
VALAASACGSDDAEAPEPGLASDAAAASAPSDAGRESTGTSDASEPGMSAGNTDAGHGSDAGRARDAGRTDARQSADDDAGAQDAGTRDAGRHDASGSDASRSDAGSSDGGGKATVVNATIIVAAGQTFDGQGQRYVAGPAVGDGSQAEGQKPLFRLEDGATLKNVVIGAPGADGVHTYGDATLQNIVWEDIGEDALTIKQPGTVSLDGGSATDGDDKVFQINAESVFRVSNFTASHAGKFIRQNGGTSFKIEVYIDRCDISYMDEAIFRTDSKVSTVSLSNTRYSQIGDALFIGVATGNSSESGNTAY